MIILTIRTDKPEAEIGIYNNEEQLAYKKWEGHKQLSTTILKKIEELLRTTQKGWKDIEGVVCYKGPGSFTGLRIGLTVGNTIANTQKVPIVSTGHENWIEKGVAGLQKGQNEQVALPEYGREAHITPQKR